MASTAFTAALLLLLFQNIYSDNDITFPLTISMLSIDEDLGYPAHVEEGCKKASLGRRAAQGSASAGRGGPEMNDLLEACQRH